MKNNFKSCFIYVFIALSSILLPVDFIYAQDFFIKKAIEAEGVWKMGSIGQRKALYTEVRNDVSEIELYVSKKGRYHLLAHIYYNWHDFSPFIHVEATDSKGKIHRGEIGFENIWYLNNTKGRWFVKSFTDSFWELPKGKLTIRFWAVGKTSVWDLSDKPMEGIIALDYFFLLPGSYKKSKDGLFFYFIQPESGYGKWHLSEYSDKYFCNLVSNENIDSPFYFDFYCPSYGKYVIGVSMLSSDSGFLKFHFQKGKFTKDLVFHDKSNDNLWHLILSDPVILKEGNYTVNLQAEGTSKETADLSIGYILFIKTD